MKLFVSPRHRSEIERAFPPSRNIGAIVGLGGGMSVIASNLFPYDAPCSCCSATGEGDTSTYCQRCGGAGEIEIIGTLMHEARSFFDPAPSGMTVIEGKRKPPRFEPRFPAGIVSPALLSRGLA